VRSIDIPRDVSTRPRKTCDLPEADGIGMDGEYDGNRRGRLAGGLIDRHSNQLGGEPGSCSTFSAHRRMMTTLPSSM